MGSRKRVARRNLERCFPEQSEQQRDRLMRDHFRALARMLFETSWAWTASNKRLDRFGQAQGVEHLLAAREGGASVMVLAAHFTCLEFGGRIASRGVPDVQVIYRPLNNPVIEWYQTRCRLKHYGGMISKRDIRGAMRALRGGGVVWSAPDQDFGPTRSEFAPFFGIQTAALTATLKLAASTGCKVVPLFPYYDRDTRKYVARFYPALENFPSGDDKADLTRINAIVEQQVRSAPEQYWWIHRRFKTRPPGEPAFYD